MQKEKEMWVDHIRLGGGASQNSFEKRFKDLNSLQDRLDITKFTDQRKTPSNKENQCNMNSRIEQNDIE